MKNEDFISPSLLRNAIYDIIKSESENKLWRVKVLTNRLKTGFPDISPRKLAVRVALIMNAMVEDGRLIKMKSGKTYQYRKKA